MGIDPFYNTGKYIILFVYFMEYYSIFYISPESVFSGTEGQKQKSRFRSNSMRGMFFSGDIQCVDIFYI